LKTSGKLILFAFIACAIVFTPQFVQSQDARGMDVVLVIDSSGSMQKTDPLSLRVPAAKLFISLLEKGDRAGIVSFSDKGYPLSDPVPVDSQENKDKLFSAADRISSDGLYTNLYEAFNSGYVSLSLDKERDREKIMILMSDGMMDVGNIDQDKILIDTLENSLTESIRKDNIKVYTIAFTDRSDRELLEKISKRTGGFFNTARTDKDFHGVFTSIFESLKSPEMVPMSENGFVIDSSIEELTIVATKSDPDTEIQIISPDGDSYSSNQKYSGIGWFESENFDMITILRPLEGRWEILFSTGESNKAYVITNLKLQSDFDQMYAIFGEHMDIRMWLERDGEKITEDQVLDKIKVYIELTGPDGNTANLQAFHKGEGIFLRTIAPFTPGNHKMKLVAEGMTFERAKSFSFNVANLEESKKDLKEQREEKKRQKESEHEGEKDGGEVSFITLFVQFIVMNIIIGIIALGYFKREKVIDFIKNINVRALIQSAKGLTTLIKRKQKGEEEGAEGEVPPDTAGESGSPQSAEDAEATVKEDPAEEQAPESAAETEVQADADSSEAASPQKAPTKQEPEETQPEAKAESTEEAPHELKTEETQAIETQPETKAESTEEAPHELKTEETRAEAGQSEDENQGDPENNMIDLEEIEMEEKGKQEEALQEDKKQMIESLPDPEDDQLDAISQESEMPGEGEEQGVETTTAESDDIELSPKESTDQPDETPQETVHEAGTGQPIETATEESEDIELSPKESADQPEETPQEPMPEEETGQAIESAPEESDEIELTPKASPDQPAEPAAEVDIFDNVIEEMEDVMNQKQPGEKADTSSQDSTPPEAAKPDAEGDASGA
jgi:hypothetical protein